MGNSECLCNLFIEELQKPFGMILQRRRETKEIFTVNKLECLISHSCFPESGKEATQISLIDLNILGGSLRRLVLKMMA